MTLPNFLIIGAPRSGTSSLFYYLKQHPQVFASPIKEPAFFIFDGMTFYADQRDYDIYRIVDWDNRAIVTELPDYEALFHNVTTETAIGEASTAYLNNHRAPDRIMHYLSDVKLIAILRDPAERAYSAYMMDVLNGLDDLRLSEIATGYQTHSRKGRVIPGQRQFLFYINAGFYYRGITRYLQRFDRSQICVLFFDDFRRDPESTISKVCQFLGVDTTFRVNTEQRHNIGRYPRIRRWHSMAVSQNPFRSRLRKLLPSELRHRLSKALVQSNLSQPPTMNSDLRALLIDIFRVDILQLQDLLERDLDHWLAV